MKQIYQGDILYAKIDKLPDNFKGKFNKITKEFVVAHGESGNQHRIVVERPTENLVEIANAGNGRFYLKVSGQATTTHEKHLPEQILDTGLYFIRQKREFSPLENRLVQD